MCRGSSVVERGPEEPGVASSILALGTRIKLSNFCPPSLSAAAKIRISLCEIRRKRNQKKWSCVCPALPCAHNKFFTPFVDNHGSWYHLNSSKVFRILQHNSTTMNNLCQNKIIHFQKI